MDFIFDPSLVLYLPLYELDGASFMSKDKHGHLCTVTGAIWTPRGRDFDGSDDKIARDSGVAGIGGQLGLTVIAWVKRGAIGAEQDVFALGATNQTDYVMLVFLADNTLRFTAGDGGSTTRLTTTATFTDTDSFLHIVGTCDPTNPKVHVNSVDEAGTAIDELTTALPSFTTYLRIGNRYRTTGETGFFNGLIGELCLFNRALTPQEIRHNYLATKWRYR